MISALKSCFNLFDHLFVPYFYFVYESIDNIYDACFSVLVIVW